MTSKHFLKFPLLLLILFVGIATTFKSDNDRYFDISKNIEIFATLYKEINTYYVDDLDPNKLMRTGIDAMLESLDPYTQYISETQIEGFRYITEGRYNGIGARIHLIGDLLTITQPYENSPAFKAGLKAGDQIMEVDGNPAIGKTPEELDAILRGYPGTTIDFKIRRPGAEKDLNIQLSREEVQIPNVPYHGMVNEDIGYIALTTFTREAGRNVADALRQLQQEHPEMKGVIFDLRNNGGGLLTEAVNVSNIFIDKGEQVVTTKGKVKERDRSFKTLNNPIDKDIPLVLLTNKFSASASEIVAGVIQDLDRGVLVGQRSYGKGLVQNTRDVGYNSKVKMTTAKYYIPSGRCIQSVSYEEGEPVHIPDDQRAPFYTRNKRIVLDGGGLKPDLLIEPQDNSGLIKSLNSQFIIFDYATQYVLQHEEIGDAKDFHFNDWDHFVNFLKQRNFSYESDSEKLLQQVMETAKKEGYDLNKNIVELEQQIDLAKKEELNEHKRSIVNLLEKEIVSRYHYQNGKIQIGLRNDPEVEEAIRLLSSPEEYAGLLK